jgi:hypothetical protein
VLGEWARRMGRLVGLFGGPSILSALTLSPVPTKCLRSLSKFIYIYIYNRYRAVACFPLVAREVP